MSKDLADLDEGAEYVVEFRRGTGVVTEFVGIYRARAFWSATNPNLKLTTFDSLRVLSWRRTV